MIYEIAEIEVVEDGAQGFEEAVEQASPYFQAASGYQSLKLQRSIEYPNRYRLIVGWNRIEDHMVTFRESDGFQQWRRLAGPFFAASPRVEHVDTVFSVDQ